MTQSLHTHSLFDDGKAMPEEMVRAAAAAGLKIFGITGTDFPAAFTPVECVSAETVSELAVITAAQSIAINRIPFIIITLSLSVRQMPYKNYNTTAADLQDLL